MSKWCGIVTGRRRERVVGHIRAVVVAASMALLVTLGVACVPPPTSGGSGTGATVAVEPSATDPAITADLVNEHFATTPAGVSVGKLAVILPGTSASTLGYTEMTRALRNRGYHVIVLRYSSAVATSWACPDAAAATSPDCYRTFRSEVTFGAGVADPSGHAFDNPAANVNRSNSMVNRLTKLLDRLVAVAPGGGWAQFQHRSPSGACTQVDATYGGCAIDWTKVAAVGHSQGAGVALYLAKFFPLDRVVMLSGSFDAYDLGGGNYSVATWITESPLAVPVDRIGVLLSLSDPGVGRIRAVAAGVGVIGPETDVGSGSSPFGGSRWLATSKTPTCPLDSAPNHNSTAVDGCVPDGAYDDAWTYLTAG